MVGQLAARAGHPSPAPVRLRELGA
ncbi:transcriptional regulator, partial [Streptomyces sp. SID7982]|nr:transcriptional regulator [Streptomyces sp. SID7982]